MNGNENPEKDLKEFFTKYLDEEVPICKEVLKAEKKR